MSTSTLFKLGFFLWVITPFTYLQCSDQGAQDEILRFHIKHIDSFMQNSVSVYPANEIILNYNPKTKKASFTLSFKNANKYPYVFTPLYYKLFIPQGTGQNRKEIKTDAHSFVIMPGQVIIKTFTIHNLDENSLRNKQLSLGYLYGSNSDNHPKITYYRFRAYEYRRSLATTLLLISGLLLWFYQNQIKGWLGFSEKALKENKHFHA